MTQRTTYHPRTKIPLPTKLMNALAMSAWVRTLIVLPLVIGIWFGVYWAWVDGSLV